MNNFWEKFEKPIIALAPMAGVTDSAYRQICKKFGADVMYSEMASVNALVYSPEKTLELLKFKEIERPYVVQLFGSNPEHFKIATRIITEKIAPDGIDINFGCPVPKIAKQKAGAELFKDISLSVEVIKATINNTNLPISIKTRIQAGDTNLLDFLEHVKDLDIKALMIHGRTLRQGFFGDIDIDIIIKSKKIFKGIVLANGGINDLETAQKVLNETRVDGLGLARGILGNPWLFEEIKKDKKNNTSISDIKKTILNHLDLVYEEKGDRGIIEFRKHLCWYVSGLSGARKIRERFVRVEGFDDIKKVLDEFF